VRAGLVAATSPPPFSLIARGDRVALVISTGPPASTVPVVSGAALAAAQRRLRQAGLAVTLVTEQSRQRANTVLRETPAAGARVRRGSVVRLTVAMPIPRVALPRVTGQRKQRAAATISALGFAVKFVNRAVSRASQRGVVLAQSPRTGRKLQRGGTVTLTVGKPKPGKLHVHG
jgi:serine/threonine-protein kinase